MFDTRFLLFLIQSFKHLDGMLCLYMESVEILRLLDVSSGTTRVLRD